ncbi:MAG: hypothetical protein HGA82_03890, partial [Anaerolineales bacterium]|nr:hypothetical protein [Anaerolineales bacterium]
MYTPSELPSQAGYEDESFSELDYAQIVADHCQTDHQVLRLDSLKPAYVE